MDSETIFPRGFSVGEYRGLCPRCNKALAQGKAGARHQSGHSACTLSQEIVGWVKCLGLIGGWIAAAVVVMFLFAVFFGGTLGPLTRP